MSKWLDKRMWPAIGFGTTFILGASSIMGGLLEWGLPVATAVIISGILIIAIKGLSKPKPQSPPGLKLTGFSYSKANWLSHTNNSESDVMDLLKGSLTLLAFERTETGLWGKSYLYRKVMSNYPLPVSRGSLTGTPLALVAMAACVEMKDHTFRDWAYPPLSQTLAENLSPDGRYVFGYRVSEAEYKTPDFEPLRHEAGGALATLLFKDPGQRDIKTIERLCTIMPGHIGWDKAIHFRTLLEVTTMPSVPRKLRRKAMNSLKDTFTDLIRAAQSTVKVNQIWADLLHWNTGAKNQWMSLWAILPAISHSGIRRKLRSDFELLLRQFLIAQGTKAHENRLLPFSISESGQASGEYIFGTAIAVVAWRTLALFGIYRIREDNIHAQRIFDRLVKRLPYILEMPSKHPRGKPVNLEGYFAWSGICLATASLGIRISDFEFGKILDLVQNLDSSSNPNEYQKLIKDTRLFSSSTAKSVAKSVTRIKDYYQKVPSD